MLPDSDAPGRADRLAEIGRAFAAPAHRERLAAGYWTHFGAATRVIDVGCGDGEFLECARTAGVEAVGIDSCEAAVARCRSRGLRVELGDAATVSRGFAAADQQFDGALVAHVIEHLQPRDVLTLFARLAAVLAPDAPVVVATPDPRNLIVANEVFWLDPTHVRPYPRALVEHLGTIAGLRLVRSYRDPHSRPQRSWLRHLVAAARSAISGADRSGPMDSVVVFAR